MRVMMIVKATKESEAGVMPKKELMLAMGAFNEELIKAGVLLDGNGVAPSSAGVRVYFTGNQKTVVDGPFTEAKELIAGYWVLQVKSMEEAVEWAKRVPNPAGDADTHLEIRPLFEPTDFPESPPELVEKEIKYRAAANAKK